MTEEEFFEYLLESEIDHWVNVEDVVIHVRDVNRVLIQTGPARI